MTWDLGMTALRTFCRYATGDGIPRSSFKVAVVVGLILNAINQGDALLGSAPVDWTKLALTFLVPYCVATYGAVSARLRAERRHSRDLGRARSGGKP
jgi:hypothetical protein